MEHWRLTGRDKREVDTLFNVWIESELFSGLPLDSAGRPSRSDSLELLRAYTEMRYFVVGKDMRWSAGVTAAGIAYGLQRYYELGSESGRWGRDPFEGQIREAVYLFHGHFDSYELKLGYLRSTTEEGTPFSMSHEFVNSGEWWMGKFGAHGISLTVRQSLLGEKPFDLFLVDAEIFEFLQRLKRYGADLDVYEGNAISCSLLGEVTRFQQTKSDNAEENTRDNHVVLGTRVQLNLSKQRSKSPAGAGFNPAPNVLGAEMHYDAATDSFREFVTDVKLSIGTAIVVKAGYSIFNDPIALPVLLGERDQTSVHGFNSSVLLRLVSTKKYPGGPSLLFRYRHNWSHDLRRLIELTDVSVFYLGIGFALYN
jgi:hypothetical protein